MHEDPIARLDQMLRGMADLTQVLHAHFTGCVEAGFTPEQALYLTAEFQRTLQLMGQGDAAE